MRFITEDLKVDDIIAQGDELNSIFAQYGKLISQDFADFIDSHGNNILDFGYLERFPHRLEDYIYGQYYGFPDQRIKYLLNLLGEIETQAQKHNITDFDAKIDLGVKILQQWIPYDSLLMSLGRSACWPSLCRRYDFIKKFDKVSRVSTSSPVSATSVGDFSYGITLTTEDVLKLFHDVGTYMENEFHLLPTLEQQEEFIRSLYRNYGLTADFENWMSGRPHIFEYRMPKQIKVDEFVHKYLETAIKGHYANDKLTEQILSGLESGDTQQRIIDELMRYFDDDLLAFICGTEIIKNLIDDYEQIKVVTDTIGYVPRWDLDSVWDLSYSEFTIPGTNMKLSLESLENFIRTTGEAGCQRGLVPTLQQIETYLIDYYKKVADDYEQREAEQDEKSRQKWRGDMR